MKPSALRDQKLSLGSLLRIFWYKIAVTWSMTLIETVLLVTLPLLVGRSIDGLLDNDLTAFAILIAAIGALLVFGIARRVYDTRAYGTMRVELGIAVVQNAQHVPVSKKNARVEMSRELVEFLEAEAPIVLMAGVQVLAAISILFVFDAILALVTAGSAILALLIYSFFGKRIFNQNRDLNDQKEQQVSVLSDGLTGTIRKYFAGLRRHEVRLSDTEAIVYGLIFAALMSMLCFNLWYAATQISVTPGQIFSIVTYSYEFIESAVMLPMALQSLTRIAEITGRLNQLSDRDGD